MSWPQPNAHGVYPATEVLGLPNPRRGWRGCDLANIRLLHLEDGWRCVTASQLSNCSGHGSGLSKRDCPHPTRAAAIAAGAARLRVRMEKELASWNGGAEARAVLRWLDDIERGLAESDLFAGLAA